MAAYKTGAFVRSKYSDPVLENASEMETLLSSKSGFKITTPLGSTYPYR